MFFLCAVVKWTQFTDFNEKSPYSIGLEHRRYISSGPSIVPFSAISKHYDKKTVCGSSKTFPESLEVARNTLSLTPEVGVPESGKRENAPPCDLSDPRAKTQ